MIASIATTRDGARANHVRLEDLDRMPIGEIAALPSEDLALLQDEAAAAFEAAKRLKEWLDGAIALRFGEQAAATRRAEGKHAGSVRFDDGAVTIVADLPKRVEWDQDALAAIVERIRTAGDDPADYVETTFKVLERRYGACATARSPPPGSGRSRPAGSSAAPSNGRPAPTRAAVPRSSPMTLPMAL